MKAESVIYKQLKLKSDPNEIHVIESLIEELKKELDFKEDVYGNIMVAVTEAVNNSIFHGNKQALDKHIYIDFEMVSSFRLLIRVRDEGTGFDPSSLPDPTAPENLIEIGGRGVFLMSQLSDELKFSDDGRQVELIFNI